MQVCPQIALALSENPFDLWWSNTYVGTMTIYKGDSRDNNYNSSQGW